MNSGKVAHARRWLVESLDGNLSDHEVVEAARNIVKELGRPDRLRELTAELAEGRGDPVGCARRSYGHVLGFDKLLLIDGGSRHMLRAHIWRSGARTPSREDIHNHRSALASCVVRGSLAMALYEPCDEGEITAVHYQESLPETSANWQLTPTGTTRLRLVQVAHYTAGGTYALPARTLHRAWNESKELTVSLYLETGNDPAVSTDVFTTACSHAAVVPKQPFTVDEYLAEVRALAEALKISDRQ